MKAALPRLRLLRLPENRRAGGELVAQARRLFEAYNHSDFQLDALGIAKEAMVAYLCEELTRSEVPVLSVREAGQLLGLLKMGPTRALSKHLGQSVWTIRHLLAAPRAPQRVFDALLRSALELAVPHADVLCVRVAASDAAAIYALEQHGFRVVGGEIIGAVDCKDVAQPQLEGIQVVPMAPRHHQAVAAIVRTTHHHNHFTYDPRFDAKRVAELFAVQVVQQAEDPGVGTLVAENSEGTAKGFIVYKRNQRLERHAGRPVACLDFIGVQRDVQASGLGALLNHAALADLARGGAQRTIVRTMMSNYRALSVLRKIGFRITSTNFVLHRWSR